MKSKHPRHKTLVVVNGHARNGRFDKLEILLRQHGIDPVMVPLKKGEDASKVIARHTMGKRKDPMIRQVLVGGGDGTLNAAAKGIIESRLPMGILPLGTANDLARTLGIPTDIEAAIKVIAGGKLRTIDMGEVNGKPYFNVASVGFSAELAKNLTREAKRKWGVLGYGITAAKLLWRSKPFIATLTYQGHEEKVRTLQVAVGNGAYYGGGMKVAADATPDNGKLDVYSLEVVHWLELPAMLPMLKTGTHTAWPTVRGLRVKELKLTTRRPMDINADGELIGRTPAVFKVREGVIRVFVPE